MQEEEGFFPGNPENPDRYANPEAQRGGRQKTSKKGEEF